MTDFNDDNDAVLRPKSLRRRTVSRLAAIQTLFQCWASEKPPQDIVPSYKKHFLPRLLDDFEISSHDDAHYTNLVFTAIADADAIDGVIVPYLKPGWTMARVSEVERSVFRGASVELRDMPHIPARSIIVEYTALADSCGGDGDFTNAIVDRLAKHYRADEMKAMK